LKKRHSAALPALTAEISIALTNLMNGLKIVGIILEGPLQVSASNSGKYEHQ
jgi:hypothetical protein